jgi:transcriptional regulator with XRE-family HTH domain
MRTLRDLLRYYRQQRGLTQEQLAALVEPAVSPDTISNLERGRTRPYRHTLEAICLALGLNDSMRREVWASWRAVRIADTVPPAWTRGPRGAIDEGQPTELIGREVELQLLEQRLLQPDVRLLTLAGPGGVGKTRLARGLVQRVIQHFADGARFVDLSALREADLVVPTLARELGIGEMAGSPELRLLVDTLRTRELLLVLDNFEQLLPAATGLAALLSGCPALKLLVTSREPLGLRWEHLHVVPPLATPDVRDPATLDAARGSPAVCRPFQFQGASAGRAYHSGCNWSAGRCVTVR